MSGSGTSRGWARRLRSCRSPSTESVAVGVGEGCVGGGDEAAEAVGGGGDALRRCVSSESRAYAERTMPTATVAAAAAPSGLLSANPQLTVTSGSRSVRFVCPCLSPTDSDEEAAAASASAAPKERRHNGFLGLARELRMRLVRVEESVVSGRSATAAASSSDGTATLTEPPYHPVHTQVEYTHYLVPDLDRITAAPYYWGVMDRFEAEALLEGKPEGTFLLRDSAQSEYLFSVSFRRYQRTLHARIEQADHRFSFDSYDPGVFSAPTVTDLILHYKDPAKCLFFEPQLSLPLVRNFPFSLAHIARAAAASTVKNYTDINLLPLPKASKDYLREYHYKQAVRVRSMEK